MIAPASLPESVRFWPWEAEPYRLWSLLDMVKIDFARLLRALKSVERARERLEAEKDNVPGLIIALQGALNGLYNICFPMPFPPSLMSNFRRVIPPYGFSSGQELVILVTSLERGIMEEMEAFGFFAIPASRRQFYGIDWISAYVLMKFRDAVADMRDAGQCYALGQWTASAFHLMRILERAFRTLARRLDVTLQEDLEYADWATLDRAVKKKIEEEHQKKRGKEKADELEFLSKCALELGYFGIAWRHNICHGRANYNEQTAKELLDRVRLFLELLAPKMP